MLTIAPPPLSRISGTAACAHRNGPVRLTASILDQGIEPAEFFRNDRQRAGDAIGVGDVAVNGDNVGPSQRVVGAIEHLVVDIEQRDAPMQLADVTQDTSTLVADIIQRAGFRAVLAVPLLGAEQIVGALVVRRKARGEFSENTVNLLQTFGA